MAQLAHLHCENLWVDKKKFDTAECRYYESLTKEQINNKNLKKCDTNCNGNIDSVLNNNDDDGVSSSFVKPKKGNTASKDKTTNQETIEETPVKSKKNKKKNKNALKNSQTSNVEAAGGSANKQANQNSAKTVDMPQSKNKRNSGQQGQKRGPSSNNHCTLVSEIAKAREHIKNSLEKMDGITTLANAPGSTDVYDRLAMVEKENADLKKLVEKLNNLVLDSQKRIAALETKSATSKTITAKTAEPPKKTEADDDDGVDLFASDSEEENEEAARIREERLAAYAAKKSKKPALIAKSSLVLDVKPWDDETDLTVMESEIRKITSDGLLWGASKFMPVAFGIKKLSISCVVEDEKVSIDWLTEEIEKLEDYVQSVDVAAFNKI